MRSGRMIERSFRSSEPIAAWPLASRRQESAGSNRLSVFSSDSRLTRSGSSPKYRAVSVANRHRRYRRGEDLSPRAGVQADISLDIRLRAPLKREARGSNSTNAVLFRASGRPPAAPVSTCAPPCRDQASGTSIVFSASEEMAVVIRKDGEGVATHGPSARSRD